jgi:hypothetical protein
MDEDERPLFFPHLCKPCDEIDRVHEKRDRWEITPHRNILRLIKKVIYIYIYIEREREREESDNDI